MYTTPDLESYKKNFPKTDFSYLEHHYSRICQTRKYILENMPAQSLNIIDIGAHWLHQTLLYALDGHRVTAADLPFTLAESCVQEVASQNQIQIYTYDDLSQKSVFDGLQSDSYDLILFTEIIEHLTFNPVDMWKGIYKILKPGGKIILTTPNYYYIGQTFKRWFRAFKRMGGSISIEDVLKLKTMGPHWKEYSVKELKQYFQLLSRDFDIKKIVLCPSPIVENSKKTIKRKAIQQIEKFIPFFRSGLYMEISLPQKHFGIEIEPSW
jgi:2-polyprenyl-6-hydroxyphenyl methylase/3-demethylubiquinone-9 3-methyltransferase